MQEIWKDIKDFEGIYQISNLGRVKSLSIYRKNGINSGYIKKEILLKPRINKRDGYVYIDLTNNGIKITYKLHRLICYTFIPNPENKPQVNHKDGNKQNNRLENLEWVTMSENALHMYRVLKTHKPKGNLNIGKDNNKSKKVGQYDLNNNLIGIFYGSRETSRKLGISQSSISRCCLGKINKVKGFKFKYLI